MLAPWVALCLVGIALVIMLVILKIEQTDAIGVKKDTYKLDHTG